MVWMPGCSIWFGYGIPLINFLSGEFFIPNEDHSDIMNKILNIIFDIGGVLILQPKIDWVINDRKLGLPPGETKKIIDDCFKKKTTDKNFNEREYFAENYGRLMSWEQYQNVLNEFFSSEEINGPLLDWIKTKKQEGYIISALTNNTGALNSVLEKNKIVRVFDRIFNSAEIGFVKPDPRLFRYVLDELQTHPESCLFVDDNEKNTEAARLLRFYVLTFHNNNDFFLRIKALIS